MNISKSIFVLLISLFSHQFAFAAQSLQVTKTLELDSDYDSVIAFVGEFCAIKDWHPAIVNCEITGEDDEKFRILTLTDGATIKERHGGKNPGGYMYSIIEGPLPVKNYNALFEVENRDDKVIVTWTATFLADGKPDDEAKQVIEGIFSAGLESISKKFK